MKWENYGSSKKRWKSDEGYIISDSSFYLGGKRIKMFCVFTDKEEYNLGCNFGTGDNLTKAKKIAETHLTENE